MIKHLKFNLGFINHDIIVTRSKREYKKLTEHKVSKDVTGMNCVRDINNGPKQNIIYINKKLKDLELFYTSVHEATHAVDDIFNIFGFNDRETRAYLQEYISAFLYYDSKSLLKDK